MTISRQSPLPLYAQVRQTLERELVEKQMQPGQMLPSEDDLARRFHVSRMTIRRALDQLVSQGRLRRAQGQGTFVADERPAPRPAGLTRWSFERIAGDDPVTRELVSVEQVSPRLRIANALHTMPGERVVELTFRLSCGNRILGISVSSIPQLLVGGVCDWEMGDKTLSEHLAGCCSLQFGKVGERVRAVPAEDEMAERLNVEPGAPLLYVDSLLLLASGIPVVATESHFIGADYVYQGILRPLSEG